MGVATPLILALACFAFASHNALNGEYSLAALLLAAGHICAWTAKYESEHK